MAVARSNDGSAAWRTAADPPAAATLLLGKAWKSLTGNLAPDLLISVLGGRTPDDSESMRSVGRRPWRTGQARNAEGVHTSTHGRHGLAVGDGGRPGRGPGGWARRRWINSHVTKPHPPPPHITRHHPIAATYPPLPSNWGRTGPIPSPARSAATSQRSHHGHSCHTNSNGGSAATSQRSQHSNGGSAATSQRSHQLEWGSAATSQRSQHSNGGSAATCQRSHHGHSRPTNSNGGAQRPPSAAAMGIPGPLTRMGGAQRPPSAASVFGKRRKATLGLF